MAVNPDNLAYDYVSFSITGQTDYDVKAWQVNLFKNVTQAGYVRITTTTAGITVKINSTSNAGIVQTTSETLQFGENHIPIRSVSNIYITNVGTSQVGILLCAGADAMKYV